VWEEFVRASGGRELSAPDGDIHYSLAVPAQVGESERTMTGQPVAVYRCSRLTFKAKVIESLEDHDVFEVITPVGRFRMTKADVYRDFPGVIASKSYRDNGIYNYPTLPTRALRYKVADP
jgi:hypothetical protein